jgi:hypothetical protein
MDFCPTSLGKGGYKRDAIFLVKSIFNLKVQIPIGPYQNKAPEPCQCPCLACSTKHYCAIASGDLISTWTTVATQGRNFGITAPSGYVSNVNHLREPV